MKPLSQSPKVCDEIKVQLKDENMIVHSYSTTLCGPLCQPAVKGLLSFL